MADERLRRTFDFYLGKTEIVIYSVLAVLLVATAFVTIATAGPIQWAGLSHWTVAAQTLKVLNQLLIVLMLVRFYTRYASLFARMFWLPSHFWSWD